MADPRRGHTARHSAVLQARLHDRRERAAPPGSSDRVRPLLLTTSVRTGRCPWRRRRRSSAPAPARSDRGRSWAVCTTCTSGRR